MNESYWNLHLKAFQLDQIDYIALSAYIWNEHTIHKFIKHLRLSGFNGKIILGGYQITYSNRLELPFQYPDAQIFISGNAEQALFNLFTTNYASNFPIFKSESVDFSQLPSPYLSGEFYVPTGTPMLRLETKRGCPFNCSFCAHRDLDSHRVHKFSLDKVFAEIAFMNAKQIRRVNILDPIFNAGPEYLSIMKEINRVNKMTTYTLQTRFENIQGDRGKGFLEYCEQGHYHLEFGLQTTNFEESVHINRKNNLTKVETVMKELKNRSISYEVSLIYGLPGQTLDSFKKSVEYIMQKGCSTIKAFPLMLLRGTELYQQKEKWQMKEETIGEFNIPLVTSSNSFTRKDWEKMKEFADQLTPNSRF